MKKQFQIDEEFKTLIPPLAEEEYKQLEENLIEEGCRDSLVIWKDVIIDGHNRYKICTVNNIPFGIKEIDFENRQEAIEWIIKNQFGRRNLSNFQRSELALRLKPIIQSKAKERRLSTLKQNVTDAQKSASRERNKSRDELAKIAGENFGKGAKVTQKSAEAIKPKRNESRDELAKIAGVSHDTIEKVEYIKKNGT